MSYVNKKIRVFKDAGDIEIHRTRSDGRMKTYTSATDARAWCDITEDRRQHILELIRQGGTKGLSLGKYIPIEAIVDILLANKNADIMRLQRENEELKIFIKTHGLDDYEQKPIRVIEALTDEEARRAGYGTDDKKPGADGLEAGGASVEGASAKGAGAEGLGAGAGGAGAGGLSSEGVGLEGAGAEDAAGAVGAGTEGAESVGRDSVEARAGDLLAGADGAEEGEGAGAEVGGTETVAGADGLEAGGAGAEGAGGPGAGGVGAEEVSVKGADAKGIAGAGPEDAAGGLGPDGVGDQASKMSEARRSTLSADHGANGLAGADGSGGGAGTDAEAGGAGTVPGESGAGYGTEGESGAMEQPIEKDKASVEEYGVGKLGAGALGADGLETGVAGAGGPGAAGSGEAGAEGAGTGGPGAGGVGAKGTGADGAAGAEEGSRRSTTSSGRGADGLAGADGTGTAAGADAGTGAETGGAETVAGAGGAGADDGVPIEEEVVTARAFSEGARPEDSSDTGGTSTSGFATDSEYESAAPDKKSQRYPEADEKAAQQLLADKSALEDQLLALKDALEDAEAFYQNEHSIAVEAMEMLESIKDIVDGGDGIKRTPHPKVIQRLRRPGTGEEASSCKDELEALERENEELKRERDKLRSVGGAGLEDKLAKLDEVTQERDRLKARVQQLEKELSGFGNLPQEIGSFKEKAQALDGLRNDENNLRKRLDAQQNLEEEVKALRDRAAAAALQPAGDSSEKDELLKKIAELEGGNSSCKCKMKELEICKVEKNYLKMRVDDLLKIQQDYEDLLEKTQGFDALKAECAKYKAKYEDIKNLECQCGGLRSKVQKCEELEKERRILTKQIEDCESCMNHQEDEIKRLSWHIGCLTQDLDNRQGQMKVKVLTMRGQIERKDCLIAKLEQKLAEVQESLTSSVEHFSCETTCLRNRIEELEGEIVQYKKMLASKEDNSKDTHTSCRSLQNLKKSLEEKNRTLEDYANSLKCKIEALENNNRCLREHNKALLENLEFEKAANVKLKGVLKKAFKNDEHLKQMLKQAKCAIKCIKEKLEKHDFSGIQQLDETMGHHGVE